MRSAPASNRDAGELRRARRRLSFVDAGNAAKVLRHDRYWSSVFWKLYLDECRFLRLRDPPAALALAVHAPELVSRISRLGEGPESHRCTLFRSEAERDSAAVRSWALVADCQRLCGHFEAAHRALGRARRTASRSPKILFAAASELRRATACYELAAGHRRRALGQVEELVRVSDEALGCAGHVDDETSLQFAESLLLAGSARSWLGPPADAVDPAAQPRSDGDLAVLARCASFARPRLPLGAAVFDAAMDLLDRRLYGPRTSPAVLEPAGSWLRRARRQPFRRGERSRRMRLTWSEGRVLSMLGISRLAQRRLQRVRDILASENDPLRLALVTLDLVMLDVGFDDRESAARRLAETRQELRGGADPELDEMLRHARHASWDSLLVFRRRLARRLERELPEALVPRPPSSGDAAYSTPSLGGVA